LVDADFIRPSVYKILHKNIQNNQEISECILSSKDIKDSLIYDESSGLYLLLGSKLFNNSLDLLLKESFKKLMAASKKIMDYVIIDAPPVTVSAHTEILADIADSSMLVVKQSTAPTNAVVDAVNLLSESKSEFLGCVYNNVHSSILGKNGSYNYNSYKYYYGHYEKKEAANN
jgi:Mrp family chromosome partitioning ATPase